MENPRAEKVAIVDEITSKLTDAKAVFVTEYRGLKVGALATLRGALRESGAEHKVYKNTLARFAAEQAGLDGLQGAARRPDGPDVRRRGLGRRGQGAARHGPDEPAARAAWRCPRHQRAVGGGHHGPRRPAVPRGAARPVRRCPAGPARQDGRPAAGPAPQLRLRPPGPHRPAVGAPSRLTHPTPQLVQEGHSRHMATKEEILDSIGALTVLELKELLDAFEERFGVTAAAPVAVAAAGARRWRCRRRRGRGEGRVRRHPHRRRRPEDPGHQGRPRAHQPGPQGGQGPRRRGPQARAREGQQGGRRGRQDQARGRRRLRRGQVTSRPERPGPPAAARPGSSRPAPRPPARRAGAGAEIDTEPPDAGWHRLPVVTRPPRGPSPEPGQVPAPETIPARMEDRLPARRTMGVVAARGTRILDTMGRRLYLVSHRIPARGAS